MKRMQGKNLFTFAVWTLIASSSADRSRLRQHRTLKAPFDDKNLVEIPSKTKIHAFSTSLVERGGAIPLPSSNELKGATIFICLDELFRKAFSFLKIPFPSQLGGCGILFVVMLAANSLKPGLGDVIFSTLTPGALFLAKWLPVFFVPGLALLPNAPSMGNTVEVLKVLLVVVAGFYYSSATTACAVLGIRRLEGSVAKEVVPLASSSNHPPAKPFSTELVSILLKGVLLSGSLSIFADYIGTELATPLRTTFMLCTTFFGYVWGARLPLSFTKIVHPLVTSTLIVLATTFFNGIVTKDSFGSTLATYKVGSLNFMDSGAGDVLLYLLGPSVVSFAISMYSRKRVIADNFLTVCTAMIVGSFGGLFGTACFVRVLNIGGNNGNLLRKSILPRNITTPLAIAIINIIGGNIPQACGVVVLTGIYGATFGQRFLNALGISDPVSRGLGMGASAQGLGVASMMSEPEAFPFAAVSMVLTAVAATVIASIPPLSNLIVNIATGA